MSVLIKGGKLPTGCRWCYFGEDGECALIVDGHFDDTNGWIRRKDCPLIELPDHGDLIDRDALMTRYAEEVNPSNSSDFMRPPRWNDAVQLTELAPAVIPAERSEDGET